MQDSLRTHGWYLFGKRYYFIAFLLVLFSACFLLSAHSASALTTVPTKMNFQGRLTDSAGNIKPNGTYNMRLRLYTVSTGGSAVWSEDRLVSASQGVTVTNGLFSIKLGDVTTLPASLFASGDLYLSVELPSPATATSASPSWTEGAMTPRNQMATSAYAYNSETLDGLDSAAFGQLGASNIFTNTNTINVASATAFDIQNGSAVSIFKVDTASAQVSVVDVAPMTAATVGSNVITSVTTNTGQLSSALGSDGFARIAYYDSANGDLKFIQCTNADCTSKNITTIDSAGTVGISNSIALGSDGFARIAYYDSTNGDLKFAQCTNAACTTSNITTVDSASNVGFYSSVSIGSDGFVRISYYANSAGDLKFAQCTNAACTTSNITTVDSAGSVGASSSIALGSDGFARIAYNDNTNSKLKFAQCTNAACTTSNLTVIADSTNGNSYHSIALGSDGFARISYHYYNSGNTEIRFVQCTNAACAANNNTLVGANGFANSFALGSDGFARIAYSENTKSDLMFVQCTDVACTTKNATVIDTYGSKGNYASVSIGSDGFARITYGGATPASTSNELYFARLTSSSGAEIRSGVSLGSSSSNAFAEVYTKKLDVEGGVTIDATTHNSFGAAVTIIGSDSYIEARPASGNASFSVTKDSFTFNDASGQSSFGTGINGFNISNNTGSANAASIYQAGTGNGLAVTVMPSASSALVLANDDTGNQMLNINAEGKTTFIAEAIDTQAFSFGTPTGNLFNIDTTNAGAVTVLGNNSGAPGSWQTAANVLPEVRQGATSVTANGYVYIMGGAGPGSSGPQSTVYYAKLNADGSVGAWQTAANALPDARYGSTSVVANGYVYVMGGYSNGDGMKSTVYYAKLNADGTVGTWQTAANALPEVRTEATSITANGYVYVMGGENASAVQSTVYYAKLNADGTVGTWSTAANALTNIRAKATSITANGYVYVMGGANAVGSGTQSTVYYAKLNADGTVGTWSSGNSLPGVRDLATSVVANGYVYAMGGDSGGAYTSTVYYAKLNANGTLGTWSTASNALPAVRGDASSVIANGYAYIIGGADGAGAVDTTYYTRLGGVLNVGGSLDLVGLQGQNLADGGEGSTGSTGGSITAGNITGVGTLQIQGMATFSSAASVTGDFSAGNGIFSVGAGNAAVRVGSSVADATGVVLVLDSKNTAGDPTGVAGAMYYNSNAGRFRCYQGSAWRDCLDTVVANTTVPAGNTVANTVTATDFASGATITAGACTAGKVYHVTARGVYGTTSTAPNLLLQLVTTSTSGTLQLAATGSNATNISMTNQQWTMEADVICSTAPSTTATTEAAGLVTRATSATDGVTWSMANTGPVTWNTTLAQTLKIRVTWSAANAANTITLRQFIMEEKNP